MTLGGREVLLVGQSFHGAQSLTERLNGWGFKCRVAGSMRAASDMLVTHPVHLVLSNTLLPDGTGFGLLEALAGRQVTAFLCLPVENSAFGCLRSTMEKIASARPRCGPRSLRARSRKWPG